jgi:hypothetical protein
LRIDGLGPDVLLGKLKPLEVWATLVPQDPTIQVNASVAGRDAIVQAITASLSQGQAAYIVSSVFQPSMQGLAAIAVSPDGQHVYGINPAQNALVVINTGDLTQRQQFTIRLQSPILRSIAGDSYCRSNLYGILFQTAGDEDVR